MQEVHFQPTEDVVIEHHDPALYHPAAHARQVADLAALDAEAEKFYRREGYLSVAQAFTPAETAGALEGLLHLIMGGNPEYRNITFEAAAREKLDTLDVDERQDAVRKLTAFVEYEPRLKALSHHPKLLAALRRLLGDEPVLLQNLALLKPPRLGREKPWHQDLAYFNYPPDRPVVGVWIALDEATIENGCMQLLPGEHHEPMHHWKRRDWQICDSEILGRRSTAAPLAPGGLLLFDGLLPHGTPHNGSAQRRRALQFHYVGASVPGIAASERFRIFGTEGKDVAC